MATAMPFLNTSFNLVLNMKDCGQFAFLQGMPCLKSVKDLINSFLFGPKSPASCVQVNTERFSRS